MIVGAAILPSAPLLVAGATLSLPAGVDRVAAAVAAAVGSLPAADVAVVVAAGAPAVTTATTASMAGIGRPDLTWRIAAHDRAAARIAAAAGLPCVSDAPLPLAHAALASHLPVGVPLVAVSVAAGAAFDDLSALGAAVAEALSALRAAVVAAGDLSAALTARSPRSAATGAVFWDEQAVAAVDAGRLDGLRRLGPDEARRVTALGWTPLSALHGVVRHAKLGMVVRHYSAPRGVGYLVACGG